MVPRLGQRAPEFVLPDAEGHDRSLSDLRGGGGVVLSFFPFAFSGVCDKEACVFRDRLHELPSTVHVAGISVDSSFTLKVFAQTYNIQYPLLSDFNKKVSRLYGVLQDPWVAYGYRGVAKRATFAVDQRGILRHKWVTDSPVVEPPYDEVLKAVK